MLNKAPILRHIIIKLSKAKDKNLEKRKKEVSCHIQGIFNKIILRFLIKTLEARRQWADIFKEMKGQKLVN